MQVSGVARCGPHFSSIVRGMGLYASSPASLSDSPQQFAFLRRTSLTRVSHFPVILIGHAQFLPPLFNLAAEVLKADRLAVGFAHRQILHRLPAERYRRLSTLLHAGQHPINTGDTDIVNETECAHAP